jgi:hypothetical protein
MSFEKWAQKMALTGSIGDGVGPAGYESRGGFEPVLLKLLPYFPSLAPPYTSGITLRVSSVSWQIYHHWLTITTQLLGTRAQDSLLLGLVS